MSLRIWAIKIGELKPLSRAGLLLFGARCAIRVEPWMPPTAGRLWSRGLTYVVGSAFGDAGPEAVAKLRLELSSCGAMASHALATSDEPLGRCMNYVTQALACAIDASGLEDGAPIKKTIIQVAKMSAAIPAILAHAGRIEAPAGSSAVDVACVTIWDAIRADIAAVANAVSALEHADDRVLALTECAALWPGEVPAWVTQQQRR